MKKKVLSFTKTLFQKSNLHEMNKSLGVFTKKYKAKTRKNMNLTNKKINSIHNMEDWIWIKKLRKDKTIIEIIKTLIKERAKNFGSEFFAKPARHGLKSPVHQDNFLLVFISTKQKQGINYLDFTK